MSLEVQQISYVRRAPLPAPSELEAYENVLAGAADRISRMAEKGLGAQISSVEGTVEDAHISTRA